MSDHLDGDLGFPEAVSWRASTVPTGCCSPSAESSAAAPAPATCSSVPAAAGFSGGGAVGRRRRQSRGPAGVQLRGPGASRARHHPHLRRLPDPARLPAHRDRRAAPSRERGRPLAARRSSECAIGRWKAGTSERPIPSSRLATAAHTSPSNGLSGARRRARPAMHRRLRLPARAASRCGAASVPPAPSSARTGPR